MRKFSCLNATLRRCMSLVALMAAALPLAAQEAPVQHSEPVRGIEYRRQLYGVRDANALADAFAHRDQMPPANLQSGSSYGSGSRATIPPPRRWSFIGPLSLTGPVFTGPFGFGPIDSVCSGRVNAAAFDPNDRFGRTLYVAAPAGGIFRTADGGVTWTSLSDTLPSLGFSGVTVDPNNRNVVYGASGDYDGGDSPGIGLVKFTYNGATWTTTILGSSTIGSAAILRKVVVDPRNSQILLVAGAGGIWRSTNGGTSFTNVHSGPFGSNIVYNLNNTILYASIDFQGVYKSVNNGQTWTVVPGFSRGEDRIDVAASQVDPNTMYVLSDAQAAIFKSTDAGVSLANISFGFPNITGAGDSIWTQGFYDFCLTSSKATTYIGTPPQPVTQDVLYVGLTDLVQSVDGGQSWVSLTKTYTGLDLAHTDHHAVAVNPNNPNDMLVCNDGGVYHYIYSPDSGQSYFTSLNANLGITEHYAAAYDPRSATHIMTGAQDQATPWSNFNLFAWQNLFSGDGGYCAINPRNPSNQYNEVQSSSTNPARIPIKRTDDNWQTAIIATLTLSLNENVLFEAPMELDAANPNILWSGGSSLWKYDATARSWTQYLNMGKFLPLSPFGADSAIGSSIRSPGAFLYLIPPTTVVTVTQIIYVGTTDGRVYITPNGGANFVQIGMLGAPVTRIAVSPHDIRRIYVTTSAGKVFRCDNSLAARPVFIDISGVGPTGLPRNISVNWLTLAPHVDEQAIYIATDIGVFFTNNGGRTWTNATAPLGLPNVGVNQIEYVPTTGFVMAATFGRGIWRLNAGNDTLLQIQPQLQGFRGNKSLLTATVQIYNIGQTGTPIETKTVPLTPAGWILANVTSQGNHDVYITIPRFLRKKLPGVAIGNNASPIITSLMYAGDVNGDNLITAADIQLIQSRMGQYTNDPVDVDGDGRVTTNDLAIARGNLGRRGD